MKTVTKKFKTVLMLCIAFASTICMAQTTHIVDNNVGTAPDFTDVQSAIDAAVTGDIIYVQQSATSYGNVNITDKGLTIIGRSSSDSGYKTQLSITLNENSSNTTIKGIEGNINESAQLVFDTIENIVISDCTLSNLTLQNQNNKNNILVQGNVLTSGITISGGTPGNILVTNNIFNGSTITFSNPDTVLFTNNIIRINGGAISGTNTETLNISNCIFIANVAFFGPTNFEIGMSGNYQISNCLTYYYNGTSLTFATNTSSINTVQNTLLNTDPLFTAVNPTNSPASIAYGGFNPFLDDLTLQAGSLAIGSGSGGVDMGIYEGYNFKPFGTPTGYPSIKIDSYSATVPKNSDLTVTIKAKTN
jgi:hypothetical protein